MDFLIDAPRAQGSQCLRQMNYLHNWLLEDGTHGARNGATLERAAARFSYNQEMSAESRAASDHSAQILRTGNALHSGKK